MPLMQRAHHATTELSACCCHRVERRCIGLSVKYAWRILSIMRHAYVTLSQISFGPARSFFSPHTLSSSSLRDRLHRSGRRRTCLSLWPPRLPHSCRCAARSLSPLRPPHRPPAADPFPPCSALHTALANPSLCALRSVSDTRHLPASRRHRIHTARI
jgi:hypothetical protein